MSMDLARYFEFEEVKRALTLLTRLLRRWGYSFNEALIYGMLLLSPKPLSAAEISELSGLSRSTVSGILGNLQKDYLVTYHKAGRVNYYEAIPALTEIFARQPREILEKEVAPLEELVKAIHVKYRLDDNVRYKRTLRDVEDMRRMLERCIEVLEERGERRRS